MSRSVRCLTITLMVSMNVSWSMSLAPSRSSVRAQSIDSAMLGGFLRSSWRTWWIDLGELPRDGLVQLGGVQADDLQLVLEVGVVEPQVQAAALQRLGELAGVVGGQQDDRPCPRLDPAELGNADLEVGEELEQHRLELLVGLVDLVDRAGRRVRSMRSRSSAASAAGTPRRRCPPARPASRPWPTRSGCGGAACGSSTRTAPWPRRVPRSTGAGRGCLSGAVARALASSVLPTPAGPSTRTGLPSLIAR